MNAFLCFVVIFEFLQEIRFTTHHRKQDIQPQGQLNYSLRQERRSVDTAVGNFTATEMKLSCTELVKWCSLRVVFRQKPLAICAETWNGVVTIVTCS
jgi:hypothetical protein